MTDCIYFATASHPFAELLVAEDAQGVCAILLGDSSNELQQDLQRRFPRHRLCESSAAVAASLEAVKAFLSRPDHPLTLKLSVHGTDFQQRVWQQLQQIPLGETRSYTEIATAIQQPTAARAVARACASNPIALAIACHRVLRSDGGISGYRWGVERKKKLLKLEKHYSDSAAGRGA